MKGRATNQSNNQPTNPSTYPPTDRPGNRELTLPIKHRTHPVMLIKTHHLQFPAVAAALPGQVTVYAGLPEGKAIF